MSTIANGLAPGESYEMKTVILSDEADLIIETCLSEGHDLREIARNYRLLADYIDVAARKRGK